MGEGIVKPLDRAEQSHQATLLWAKRRRPVEGVHRPERPTVQERPERLRIEESRLERDRRADIRGGRFFRAQDRELAASYRVARRQETNLTRYSFLRSSYHGSRLINSLFKDYSALNLSRRSLPQSAADRLALYRIGRSLREVNPAVFKLSFLRDLIQIHAQEKLAAARDLGIKIDEKQTAMLKDALLEIIQFFDRQIDKLEQAALERVNDVKLANKRKEKVRLELVETIKALVRKLEELIAELNSASRGSPQISYSQAA